MYCPNCGEKVEDTNKFCGNCGSKLIEESTFVDEEIKKAEVFSNKYSHIGELTKDNDIPENGNYESPYRDKKKGKRKFVLVYVLVIVLIAALFIFVNKDALFKSNGKKRTIMIYLVGSNLESDHLAATKDINEIIRTGKADDMNILIYTGGTKRWHKTDIPNNKHAIFRITNDGLEKLDEYTDGTNSVLEPKNLAYFLKFGYTHYKSDNYSLILWDHGSGPIYGYGHDEYNIFDTMTLMELKEALDNSPFNGMNKLEFIGFDACLMSSVEIASVLSDYTDYMIASQETEPGNGWNYSFLEKVDDDTTTVALGKLIVDYYDDYYSSRKSIEGTSLSLLRISQIDNVEKRLDELFKVASKNLEIDFSYISRSRSNSMTYGKSSSGFDLIDLLNFIDKLPAEYKKEIDNLDSAIKDLVVYQKTDLKNTNGVSIYFPYYNRREYEKNAALYKEIGFSEEYNKYINEFIFQLTGKRLYDWDFTRSNMISLGQGKVSIELTEEERDNYSSASYILFERKDDKFTPVFSGSDVQLIDNTLSINTSRKLIKVENNNDKMYVTAIESEKGTDYTKYYIPAILSRINEETMEFDIIEVYLELVTNEDNLNGYISRAIPMNLNENNSYPKIDIDINEWDTLKLTNYSYNILDEEGNYITDWVNSNEALIMEINLDEPYEISFEDIDITNDYYCIFKIYDSQRNSYYSNIIEVNNSNA